MSLFDGPLGELRRYLDRAERSGTARTLQPVRRLPWAERAVVVLEGEARLELGNPAVASCAMVLWGGPGEVRHRRITLVGPDLPETPERSLPFAQAVMVAGEIDDPVACFRALRQAVYGLRLRGVSTRNHPSRQRVWYRASAAAVGGGFDAALLGSALGQCAAALPFVRAVEVLLVTAGREEVTLLGPIAERAADIGAALLKLTDETSLDCDGCDYSQICGEIDELRRRREARRSKERQ
jgi:CO dehydrogenase/acetyl-CoA synthase beta subunit